MSWWRRVLPARGPKELPIDPNLVPMSGWEITRREPLAVYWRDVVGDVVSLALLPTLQALPALSHTRELQRYCRSIAESQNAGLVEVACTVGTEGPSVTYIYKRLEMPAFRFFGVALTPVPQGTWQWMIISGERGVTGTREAVVAGRLIEGGQLTPSAYEATWASDPYDPLYRGVDRGTLCYISDAEEYDEQFPDHPLAKVRRELKRLLSIPLSPITAA
jgi:hypothetical protein